MFLVNPPMTIYYQSKEQINRLSLNINTDSQHVVVNGALIVNNNF
ncbi:MAG: hypothetical protein BAJATHORv1_20442 [Candidatus Thorarchaeota archaeon]|nr:MAG: hypothetical protein BAJATHORv1_20442 [Candidatus Thorarchaeota archaeon]